MHEENILKGIAKFYKQEGIIFWIKYKYDKIEIDIKQLLGFNKIIVFITLFF